MIVSHVYLIDVTFRVRTAALQDIYEVLAACSKKEQDLQLLPWERHRFFNEMVEKLDKMADAIQDGLDSDCQLWPSLASHSAHVGDEVSDGVGRSLFTLPNI